ncbi:hypothetical protein LWI29_020722 [Acer saccharum]|uniref:HD domain-containing protein n=1 Tax=Acer saccharum TaxID=4024 RepID=A0AA39UV21_ACESA|nr:hypothetical protein LWI29_020722 [Acer saccharum]
MGASMNDESSSFYTWHGRRLSKHVHDNVHGNIYLDPLSLKFIDTEQFQRLRDLKQLGLSHLVYPGAVHSRFEHSLGVYWLAGAAVNTIKAYQGSELEIDHSDIQTVKLAGLLHDVGHGPFSHLFEKGFLPRVLNGFRWFDYITRDSRACGLGCNFQFERLMETMRVMDDEICYRAKDYLTIHKLFTTRADLHRTVYTHAKVKAIELMVVDALLEANNCLGISSSIQQPEDYWKLDDSIIKTILTDPRQELKEARDLILRIRRRDIYQFCNEISIPKDKLEHFKDITPQDIVCSQKAGVVTLKEEDVAVCNVQIDLTRGKNNPLERINFFKDYDCHEKFPIRDESISQMLPTFNQDKIVRVYSKKPELVEAVSDAFENYQLKMFGMKAQVHATPEKKKRRR